MAPERRRSEGVSLVHCGESLVLVEMLYFLFQSGRSVLF